MTIRSQLTTVFMVGMLVLSLAAFVPAAAGQESTDNGVQTLDNGEALYLSFGADLEDTSLEEYVQAHASDELEQDSVAEIIQYQDVDQVNINTQAGATSVSIDGGEATAVQEANQYNDNEQLAEADATNEVRQDQFENVGEVYILLGNGNGQEFDGWAVMDEKDKKGDSGGDGDSVSQTAVATVNQHQEVDQLNYNNQSTAIAIAEDGSESIALQQSEQYNENLQQGVANATNVYTTDGDGDKKKKGDDGSDLSGSQFAEASVEQSQDVDQMNVNEQGAAVAIAIGDNSTATAIQVTDQTNLNTQFGSADAANIIGQMSGMNAVSAVTDGGGEVLTTDKDKKGDKDGVEKKDDGDSQYAEASVTQYQSVEQININMQNMAVAIATNESDAAAVQMSTQENYNAQIGAASAANVAGDGIEGTVYTDRSTLTVGGDDVTDNERFSFDYDGNSEQLNDVDQYTTAMIEQVQYVGQLNLNEQHAAIAVAENGGEASSVQISMQTNENYQFASADAETIALAC
ncbi:hypothetical protein OB955_02735 [Halobacteria archaeon AArc-m2/3/4]|uniref:Uncharacterized protein n=1 Tax=Natronoglomus mannanivorans TaxID=2979990 RepID=A0AAP2YVG2_9EURY|nr:hypothetical protein [Halobacteria archaeon AArc-xg1-1]MCU4971654.1 hypothetical protein [Halobacteria archaeon AArc-m2/3/4]